MNLLLKSTAVLDSAPYHNVLPENTPPCNIKKEAKQTNKMAAERHIPYEYKLICTSP
jgi:hypothetical protein